jgi:Gas vesicle synthesis protein GvpO
MSPVSDRDEARKRREQARRQRRDTTPQREPEESPPEHDGGADAGGNGSSLLGAAGVAAAGAAVGAALGAARALSEHRDGSEQPRDADEEQEPENLQQPEEDDEPEREPVDAEHGHPEPENAATPQPAAREPEREPVEGATTDETADAVRRAREQLLALHGSEPESISSLERTADGWRATFEVVELRRVPDSTDVLASYEVVLDESLNVIRYARVRRYYRAQSDHEER